MNSAARIQTRMLTSCNPPAAVLATVKEISPRLRPVAMLKVSGMATMVTNAGKASVYSSHFTLGVNSVISAPTRIKAGAVANTGITVTTGENNTAARNSRATTTLLRPVRADGNASGALNVTRHRRSSRQRAKDRSNGVGEQRAAHSRYFSLFDESGLLANAD